MILADGAGPPGRDARRLGQTFANASIGFQAVMVPVVLGWLALLGVTIAQAVTGTPRLPAVPLRIVCALVTCGVISARFWVGPMLVRAFARRLDSFPFGVEGWFEVLRHVHRIRYALRVELRFQGAAPEAQRVKTLVNEKVHPPATVLAEGPRELCIESTWIDVEELSEAMLFRTNAAAQKWLRRVLDKVVLPVAKDHPLERLRVVHTDQPVFARAGLQR